MLRMTGRWASRVISFSDAGLRDVPFSLTSLPPLSNARLDAASPRQREARQDAARENAKMSDFFLKTDRDSSLRSE